MPELISREDARLCASLVKEVARAQGLVREPSAIGKLTVSVAKLYNKGLRDRHQLLAAALLLPK
ncbi:hypothetical protein [Rhizobium skierniewicense]|uniref:hypothetical protein n=1 Tax=Rhizobium skierniewicense TaxID=984260 RepID=UPI001573EB41|nr:hypothetical protein [Rhizobium skierniewicense]NTF31932.1 hypothetical protein [Rhizobium skierniewicense]